MTDLYSSDPCPRCKGSGRTINPQALQKLLISTGIPQKTFAHQLNIKEQVFSDLLRGRRHISINLLEQILHLIPNQFKSSESD